MKINRPAIKSNTAADKSHLKNLFFYNRDFTEAMKDVVDYYQGFATFEDGTKDAKKIKAIYQDLDKGRKEFFLNNEDILIKKRYPWKWMFEDEILARVIDKYKLFNPILNEVNAYQLLNPFKIEEKYIKDNVEYEYAAWAADSNFYKSVLPGKMVQRTLEGYLVGFSGAGVYKFMGNYGKYRNIPIYSLGYYSKDSGRRVFFLTKELLPKLRKFVPRKGMKKQST